ncbi:hypothetical protein [Nocardia sp. NPDC024068]|uniref:hypothetical protein n=1 Tax=Nocardia sp. NPDC024068 TaxID=3157197 RepID=UPI0034044E36
MSSPLSGLCWLKHRKCRDRAPADLLAELGRGEIALTHEAFHALSPWRAAAHLEELLMTCGILPQVDKQICAFERWTIRHLAAVTDPEHARLIKRFGAWDVAPRLRARAERNPLTVSSRRGFSSQITQATQFLGWLAEHDLELATADRPTSTPGMSNTMSTPAPQSAGFCTGASPTSSPADSAFPPS